MNSELLLKLLEINEEEKYLAVGDSELRDLYSKSSRFLIERRHISNLLGEGSTAPILLRTHPRFREFPVHSHDFIEIMYMVCGSLTHVLGQQKITLIKGDLIIFGKNARHRILTAGEEDIGINIIVSADLFEGLVSDLRHSSVLAERLFEPLLTDGENHYRIFHTNEEMLIENLMENMVSSIFEKKKSETFILRQSLLLLMGYLANLPGSKTEISDNPDNIEVLKRKIQNYIRTSYNSATLTEAAEMLGFSPPYLSRWIKKHFGLTFKELLTEERFRIAAALLDGSMRISEIIEKVGYENSSYFHKEFRRRYGTTPANFRKSKKF